ncbi:MAG: coenzyme M methyltransferase subunit X [uncultured bacterium]|nr:MAG: coenzyme M methyltransferase subunit X [uncultured bacterium]
MKDLEKVFLDRAKKKKRKIAIAILRPIKETVDSLISASEFAELTVVGVDIPGFNCFSIKNTEDASQKLLSLLKDGSIEGIVRGQVKDTYTLDLFYKYFNKTPIPSNKKVCPAVMKKDKYSFVVGTCSVYQGHTLNDKIYEAEKLVHYIDKELKLKPKIGVMGILRPTSKHGKYQILDEITKNSRDLAKYLLNKGYDVKEYYMEYETAVWEGCNLILPSIGYVGNSWLKALLYLGDWKLLSCPYLDLDVVYEDGSRNETDYFNHIIHAVAMLNKDNK